MRLNKPHKEDIFLVITLAAALLGFGGIASGATEISKGLFFVFMALFVLSMIEGLLRQK